MGARRWTVALDGYLIPIGGGREREVCDDGEQVVLATDYDRDVAEAWQEGALHERQQRVVEAIFFSPGDCAKPFVLQRDADISGVSGEGIVADGVEFPDGCVALRWRGGHPTSVVFHDRGMESVEAIHGHGGNTRIVYVTEDIGERAAEVAEAETRGWNKAVEAAIKAVDGVYPVSDQWGHHTLPHIDRRQASAAIAALRKPEVEG